MNLNSIKTILDTLHPTKWNISSHSLEIPLETKHWFIPLTEKQQFIFAKNVIKALCFLDEVVAAEIQERQRAQEIAEMDSRISIDDLALRYDNSFLRIAQGMNRIVLLIGGYAVKIPNPRYGQEFFLRGMYNNVHERRTWLSSSKNEHLMPVFFMFPLGLFTICRRYRKTATKSLSRKQLKELQLIFFDNNGDNAAVDDRDRIVALDYGDASWIAENTQLIVSVDEHQRESIGVIEYYE